MYKKLIIFILLSVNLNVLANDHPVDSMVSRCILTPKMNNMLPSPASYNRTNNLYQKTGSFETANGQKIMIAGRLMDRNCVPIDKGVIRLWQADSLGKISYKIAKSTDSPTGDVNFAGTGVANSNNLGRFVLSTIMPGIDHKHQKTNFLNIMVEADGKTLQTKLYFDPVTALHDSEFSALSRNQREIVLLAKNQINNDSVVYYIDIVMDYVQSNRTY